MFIKVFNDYSCIYNDNEIKNLAHYTDIDALISILENKELRAKSIMDFQNDDWEGRLSINKLFNMIVNDSIIAMTPNQLNILQKKIGNDDKINEFMRSIPTYVTCFSKNLESNYMKNDFVSDATNGISTGRNIVIVFDAEKLKKDMYILTPKDDKKYCVHMGKIIYDEKRQISIIKDEAIKLWNALLADPYQLVDEEKIDYLLKKIYYIGVCFKNADGVMVSEDEEEVRSFINLVDNRTEKFTSYLPKEFESENKKYKYRNIKFNIEDIQEIQIFRNGDSTDEKIENVKSIIKRFIDIDNHRINLRIV